MSDLSFHVRHFVPDCDGEELEHRTTLLKARDYAAALRGRTASHDANNLACLAHEVAGGFVYADAPPMRLKMAGDYCRHLIKAAMLAENIDAGVGE